MNFCWIMECESQVHDMCLFCWHYTSGFLTDSWPHRVQNTILEFPMSKYPVCRQAALSVARYGPATILSPPPASSILYMPCLSRTVRLTSAWIKSLIHWIAFSQKQNFVTVNLCRYWQNDQRDVNPFLCLWCQNLLDCYDENLRGVACCWSWCNTPWPRHQVCSLQCFLSTLSTSSGLIGFWRVFNGLLMLIHFVFSRAFLPGG